MTQVYEGDTVELTLVGKNLLKSCGYGSGEERGVVVTVGRFYNRIKFPSVTQELLLLPREYKVVSDV